MIEPRDSVGAPLALGDRCLVVRWCDPCGAFVLGVPVRVVEFQPHAGCVLCRSLYWEPAVRFEEPVLSSDRSPLRVWVQGCPASWLRKLPPLDPSAEYLDTAETALEELRELLTQPLIEKERL